jgi:DNA-binding response OmpR family regulator
VNVPRPIVDEETLHVGNLEIRPREYTVLISGQRVALTVREFQVLLCLALQADRVVTRQHIYEQVWGGAMGHRDRSVDVFVRKVRRKLAAVDPDSTFVHTHFGFGYRLSPEPIQPAKPPPAARPAA